MEVFAAVISKLADLGYPVTDMDNNAVHYNIGKAEANLRISTNQSDVPEGLFHVWVDMAAGLFLTDKKAQGALAGLYDFEAPAKRISEGDTSVDFAIADTGSAEDQFDAMLYAMIHPSDDLIIAFRRLVW